MATLKITLAGTMQAASSSLSLNLAVHVFSALMPLKQHWRLEVLFTEHEDIKTIRPQNFWRLVLGLKLSSCRVYEWTFCSLGPKFANSSHNWPLFLQKTSSICHLVIRDFRVIISVPIFAVMNSKLNIVI